MMGQAGLRCAGSVTLLLLLTVVGCSEPNQYVAPPPPEVTVAYPLTEEVSDFIEFTGTTQAIYTVNLRARVNGYLQSINFTDGATVEKGDLLFVIEPEPFEAELASAQANLQKAEAALKLAEAEVKRTTPLVQRGALPQQELDIKIADQATAEANVAAAKASLRQAELNLSYTKIVAPISGRIGRRMVDVGNLVQSEQTELTTIQSFDPIYAYFTVSESDVLRLLELQGNTDSSNLQENQTPIALALGQEEGFPHLGMLDFSDLGVDPATGTQLRRAVFANEDHSLLPGLFVRLRLQVGAPTPQLLVAERAIATDQRGEYLLVVNKEDVVEYRPVDLGINVQGYRVVKDGVSAGERVVINGLQRARPGAKVTPQEAERMANRPDAAPFVTATLQGEDRSSNRTASNTRTGG